MSSIRKSSVRYQDPKGRWTENPQNATRRLTTRLRAEVTYLAETVLEEKRDDAWVQLANPERLSLPDQGFWWRGYRHRWQGNDWMVCEGARPWDPDLWQKMGKPNLYTLEGQACLDPIEAGYHFMIPWDEATKWARTVQGAGGSVVQWDLDERPLGYELSQMEKFLQTLRSLIARGEEMDFLEISRLSPEIWAVQDEFEESSRRFRSELKMWFAREERPKELMRIQEAMKKAENAQEEMRQLFNRHLQQRMRIIALSEKSHVLDAKHHDDKAPEIMMALALYLARAGVRARLDGEKIIVPVEDKLIVIGPHGVSLEYSTKDTVLPK